MKNIILMIIFEATGYILRDCYTTLSLEFSNIILRIISGLLITIGCYYFFKALKIIK